MCFGCSKEPSHWDGSFEYPQHMFWLRNKKNNYLLRILIGGPEGKISCYVSQTNWRDLFLLWFLWSSPKVGRCVLGLLHLFCFLLLFFHFPTIRLELKISTYPIRVCFSLYGMFLLVTRRFHPLRIRRRLIFELICESIKFMCSEIQIQLAGLLIVVLFLLQLETPQCSVANPYHVFLEEHMFSE